LDAQYFVSSDARNSQSLPPAFDYHNEVVADQPVVVVESWMAAKSPAIGSEKAAAEESEGDEGDPAGSALAAEKGKWDEQGWEGEQGWWSKWSDEAAGGALAAKKANRPVIVSFEGTKVNLASPVGSPRPTNWAPIVAAAIAAEGATAEGAAAVAAAAKAAAKAKKKAAKHAAKRAATAALAEAAMSRTVAFAQAATVAAAEVAAAAANPTAPSGHPQRDRSQAPPSSAKAVAAPKVTAP
jgi:hypothetical protein